MTKLIGKVVRKEFGTGSKSEHAAVFLETEKARYRLKRKGGNPFTDPELDKWVGKRIVVAGKITPHFFVITSEPEEYTQ